MVWGTPEGDTFSLIPTPTPNQVLTGSVVWVTPEGDTLELRFAPLSAAEAAEAEAEAEVRPLRPLPYIPLNRSAPPKPPRRRPRPLAYTPSCASPLPALEGFVSLTCIPYLYPSPTPPSLHPLRVRIPHLHPLIYFPFLTPPPSARCDFLAGAALSPPSLLPLPYTPLGRVLRLPRGSRRRDAARPFGLGQRAGGGLSGCKEAA